MSRQRRRWLVAYDIRDDKRLRLVFKAMKGYGEHLQYSVFLCDLSPAEKPAMLLHIGSIINHAVDSVVYVDLGEVQGRGEMCFEFQGAHPRLPRSGPLVI